MKQQSRGFNNYFQAGMLLLLLISVVYGSNSYSFTLPQESRPKQSEPQFIAFDKAIYELAYTTLLANNNLKMALELTEYAVKQRPDDLTWRRRYALVSEWSGESYISLAQWRYLFQKTKSRESYNYALRLAKALQDYGALVSLYQYQYNQNPASENNITNLANALINNGDEGAALALLKQNAETPLIQSALLNLHKELGHPLEVLKSIARLEMLEGKSESLLLEKIKVHLQQHDQQQAYQALKQYDGEKRINDRFLVATLASLAWNKGDFDVSLNAYKRLYDSGEKTPEMFSRLIWIEEKKAPEQAFKLSQDAMHLYPTDSSALLRTIYLGVGLKKWDSLKRIFSGLSQEQEKTIASKPVYYTAKAAIYMADKKPQQALKILSKGRSALPSDNGLLRQYLWTVIDYDKPSMIFREVRRHYHNQEVENAINYGLVKLGFKKLAINRMYKARKEHKDDVRWLLDYADLLRENNEEFLSILAEQRAWKVLRKQKKVDVKSVARLVNEQSPPQLKMALLQQLPKHDDIFLDVMSWTLTRENYPLAFYLYALSKEKNINLPAWIEMNLALETNDKIKIQQIFKKTAITKIPHREVVEGKDRVGDVLEMQSLAYQGLAAHPNDTLTYIQFKQKNLPYAPFVAVDGYYHSLGSLTANGYQLSAMLLYTPRLQFRPTVTYRRLKSNDFSQLINVPRSEQIFSLQTDYKYHYNTYRFIVGSRKTMKRHYPIRFHWLRKWTHSLDTTLMVDLQTKADDTTFLQIGGKKNDLGVNVQYRWTERDYLEGTFNYSFLSDLNNVRLGRGATFFGTWRHLFYFSYPDFNARLYLNHSLYWPTANNSPLLNQLTPAASGAPYLPGKFTEFGIIGGIGQRFEQEYTHALKLFAEAGLLYNNTNGFGQLFNGGFALSIFGRDHLAIYTRFSRNQGVIGQIDYLLGMKYRIYV